MIHGAITAPRFLLATNKHKKKRGLCSIIQIEASPNAYATIIKQQPALYAV